jgi:RNA polymerase sigma-70 factor (ECF subfamily)
MVGGCVARMGDPAVEPLVVDARLMQQVIDGCESALASLYDRYAATIFGAVTRIVGDRAMASDVVQETFLGLWDRAETFDASRGSLRAWLLRIAHNRAVDHLRSQRREPAAAFSSFDAAEDADSSIAEWLTASGRPVGMGSFDASPEEVVDDTETHASILGAMRSLDPIERSVIELAYGEELSQSEIAVRLGWPLGTVKTRTRRALRHLRESLEPPTAQAPTDAVGSVRIPVGRGSRNAVAPSAPREPRVPA